ncbi:unnamed protein product, partial [Musa acuminata var. zebrina]
AVCRVWGETFLILRSVGRSPLQTLKDDFFWGLVWIDSRVRCKFLLDQKVSASPQIIRSSHSIALCGFTHLFDAGSRDRAFFGI